MWTYEHTIVTTASPEAVWGSCADPAVWPEWDEEIRELQLDGPFGAGVTGTMHLYGLPPLAFAVTEATERRGLSTETALEDGTVIRFVHRLTDRADGGTRIVHRVELEGPSAGDPLGGEVTGPVPAAMRRLGAVAAARGR
ncbi:SRPBCC family protein [Streptomyces sp. NPDC048057]|uniref:SRPBCC family protein n=1 Tax=Streptomyces sp. NPDC048057 TaxID=3155628 RepID=UPI0033F4C24F